MSSARNFRQQLGQELAEVLGGEFRFLRSKLLFQRERDGGQDEIVLQGASRNSPYISVSFDFGRRFDRVAELERRLGIDSKGFDHVAGNSLNAPGMKGLNYPVAAEWPVNLNLPAPTTTASVLAGFEKVAFPFFERFTRLQDARDGVARRDSWILDGHFTWRNLLLMDAVLGDLNHFRDWSARRLRDSQAEQAAALLAQLAEP